MAQIESTFRANRKVCRGCGEAKPLDGFPPDRRASDGKQSSCRECAQASTRAWRARNREKYLASKARWRKNNPELVRKHKQTEYERDREKIIARVSRWRKNNPVARAAQEELRRSRKAGVGGAYCTRQKVEARFAFYANRCLYCGKRADTIDHRIPLARGGPHLPANLMPTCRSCNARKHTRTESEFLAENGRR